MFTPRHTSTHFVSLAVLVAVLSLGLFPSVSAQPLTPPGRLAAGAFHTLFANPDGTLWVAGSNSSGQLGTGNYTPYRTPQQVTTVSNIVAVAAGSAHSLALSVSGTVYAFGANSYG